MGWKCLLGHKWDLQASHHVDVFDEPGDPMPDYMTRFLYLCLRCKEIKIKTVDGRWYVIDKDDDDEGDKDPPPPLSPDDYYDKLTTTGKNELD